MAINLQEVSKTRNQLARIQSYLNVTTESYLNVTTEEINLIVNTALRASSLTSSKSA